MIPVLLSVCLFALASTSLESLASYSIALRALSVMIVLIPVLWRKRALRPPHHAVLARGMWVTGFGFILYLAASTLMHGAIMSFAIGLTSFLLVALVATVLAQFYSPSQVMAGTYWAFMVLCSVSLAMFFVAPDVAIENARLRGVLENANGLGFVAFSLGVVSLGGSRRAWQTLSGISLAVSCLFLSGSRASLVALTIFVGGISIGGMRRARRVLLAALVAIGIGWFIEGPVLSDSLLFRATDTRSVGFQVVQRAMHESFWIGWGELPPDTMIAGSVFAAGITGGVLGLLGLTVMYGGLLRNLAASRPRGVSLVLAGVVHSVFESWMLSFSAPMLFCFFTVLVGLLGLDTEGAPAPARSLSGKLAHTPRIGGS